jgi:lipoprotein-releasing system permease protein
VAKIRDQVEARNDVVTVSPTTTGPALVVRGSATQSVSVIGILPEQYNKIVPLSEK